MASSEYVSTFPLPTIPGLCRASGPVRVLPRRCAGSTAPPSGLAPGEAGLHWIVGFAEQNGAEGHGGCSILAATSSNSTDEVEVNILTIYEGLQQELNLGQGRTSHDLDGTHVLAKGL